jgi:hypothetical protein
VLGNDAPEKFSEASTHFSQKSIVDARQDRGKNARANNISLNYGYKGANPYQTAYNGELVAQDLTKAHNKAVRTQNTDNRSDIMAYYDPAQAGPKVSEMESQ